MIHLLFEETNFTKIEADQRFGDGVSIYEDFLESGLLRDNNPESGTISFVGVGVSGQHTVKFAPKIFRRQEPPSDTQFRLLIRTLKKYSKTLTTTHPDSRFLRTGMEESSVSQIAQADWFIADYFANGLYRAKPNTKIKKDALNIDWVKTISRTNLAMSNGRPVYLNPIGRTTQTDISHLVTRLHRFVVESCFFTYAPLLGLTSQNLDHEVVPALGKLPERTVIERTLRHELYRNYSEREIRLLKMLIGWFREELTGASQQFKPYGVRNFWAVWEAVCKLIFHDEVAHWQPMIPAPSWSSTNGDSQFAGGKWLPDVIMSVRNTSAENTLFILDAKYYDLRLPPRLSGEPGVGDVTKQLFYNQVLKVAAKEAGYQKVVNCLVFPTNEKEFIRVAGNVNIQGVSGGPLLIVYLNAFMAFERFLANNPLGQGEQLALVQMCQDALSSL